MSERVRVVTYIPVRTNQILQAHASLEGTSKQEVISAILQAHAETLTVATLKQKEVIEEPAKPKRIKKKTLAKKSTKMQPSVATE
jgi:hypothetical protein